MDTTFFPHLPEPLRPLLDLALDVRWTWSHWSDALWARVEPYTWQATHNPWLVLQAASARRLQELARDEAFIAQLEALVQERQAHYAHPHWFHEAGLEGRLRRVAYFSMEFGLGESLLFPPGAQPAARAVGLLPLQRTGQHAGTTGAHPGRRLVAGERGLARARCLPAGVAGAGGAGGSLPVGQQRSHQQPGGPGHHGRAVRWRAGAASVAGNGLGHRRLAGAGGPGSGTGGVPSQRRTRRPGRPRPDRRPCPSPRRGFPPGPVGHPGRQPVHHPHPGAGRLRPLRAAPDPPLSARVRRRVGDRHGGVPAGTSPASSTWPGWPCR